MHFEVNEPHVPPGELHIPAERCLICEAEAKGLVKRERTIFLEVKSMNGIAQTGRYLKLSEAVYNALATQFSVPNRD